MERVEKMKVNFINKLDVSLLNDYFYSKMFENIVEKKTQEQILKEQKK